MLRQSVCGCVHVYLRVCVCVCARVCAKEKKEKGERGGKEKETKELYFGIRGVLLSVLFFTNSSSLFFPPSVLSEAVY